MLGRSEPVSLSEIQPSGPLQRQDRRKDEEPLKFPSKKPDGEDTSLLKTSNTLDVLKSESTFETLTKKLIGENASLSISFNEEVNNFIYQSVDKETGEILNQWPPEDYIRKLASLLELKSSGDSVQGQAVDETV